MGLGKRSVFPRILALITVVLVIASLLRIGWKTSWNQYLYESNTKSINYSDVTPMVNITDWRTKELWRLGDLVQRRIAFIQNPKNCDAAKKILCHFNINVGYGSQMHDGINCLIIAYATQRTLILDSSNWVYTKRGLESMFQPLSNCTSIKNEKVVQKSVLENIGNIKVIELPRLSAFIQLPYYLPFSIPADLAENISRVHDNPSGWWIGQFLVYITRQNHDLKQFIHETERILEFRHPIVGIHIRRQDKQAEALYHDLVEYMNHVDDWYEKTREKKTSAGAERRVFLASDDSEVIQEARKRYPNYKFISTTKYEKKRYTESALREVVVDIELLSMCDFVVCTLSSNIGRLTYELMHVRFWDAPSRIKSLDLNYTFHQKYFIGLTQIRQIEEQVFPKRVLMFKNVNKNRDRTLISLDNEKLPVKMPTYPGV